MLGPEDKVRTLGYRLMPVHSYKDKSSPPEIKGYRAVNQIEVKVLDVARLGTVIDTAMKNGATRVNGPYWGHSRLEELQRQAAVNALERARRLAEALAQAAGLKIKGVDKISTGIRIIAPRAPGGDFPDGQGGQSHAHRSGGGRDQRPHPGGIPGKSLTSGFFPAFLYKG